MVQLTLVLQVKVHAKYTPISLTAIKHNEGNAKDPGLIAELMGRLCESDTHWPCVALEQLQGYGADHHVEMLREAGPCFHGCPPAVSACAPFGCGTL